MNSTKKNCMSKIPEHKKHNTATIITLERITELITIKSRLRQEYSLKKNKTNKEIK